MKFLFKLPLHLQIVISIITGVIFALVFINAGGDPAFSQNWIKPFGDIFIKLLKMIAIPLVLASLIVGVANLGDISKLSQLGGKTIAIYLVTTILATSIGLILVNIIQPGKKMDEKTRQSIVEKNIDSSSLKKKMSGAAVVEKSGPL